MKINLTAIFDEEARKQIREQVLGQARNIARSEVERALSAEIKRVGAAFVAEIESGLKDKYGYRFRSLIEETVGSVLKSRWTEVGERVRATVEGLVTETLKSKIDAAVANAVHVEIQKKLADKTVWEAKGQDDYVRKVARSELKRILRED